MRAVGYCRVSTVKQEDGTSLAAQEERIADFCRSENMELVSLVRESRSGGVRSGEVFSWEGRPELTALMADAAEGKFDALVVAKFDRLSRDHATLVALRRMLERHGVAVISAAERNGDSAQARLLENTLAIFAEFERELIAERMRLGKARRKAEAKHAHGRVPYGYSSSAGTLSVNESEAVAVREIFRLAARGDSSGKIAIALSDAGLRPRLSPTWGASSVRSILRNPTYRGEKYGKRDAHTAIVSESQWRRAQKSLASNRKRQAAAEGK